VQLVAARFVLQGHDHRARPIAHDHAHLRLQSFRSALDSLGLQNDFWVTVRLEQPWSKHVALRAFLCLLRHAWWKVRPFLRAQRFLIHDQLAHGELYIKRCACRVFRHEHHAGE
jgi:hypothetical protein